MKWIKSHPWLTGLLFVLVASIVFFFYTDLYIKGNFEYTVQHQLSLSQDDELCIHPLFSGIYQGDGKLGRPVYPYGSVLEDADYRDTDD